MKLFPGSILAERYRLTRPLGEGGMGEVWAALNTVTGRPVALKLLLHGFQGHLDGQVRARFVLEAQAACAVEHPNVVQILDFVESGGQPPILVMELLEGETLASKLARARTLPVSETARLLLPVVSAVGTAHARGIVHRDLKPANIFLSGSGGTDPVVKVLDFGIAKWLAPRPGESPLRTQTGSTLGTPCYMSPEQATGDRMIDHRADIWSLGIILYECLTGVRPVEGQNAAHIVSRLLTTGIMPIERLVPTLPPEVGLLVRRMLTREPAQRIQDLREVGRVLTPLAGTSAPAFGEPHLEPVSEYVPSTTPPPPAPVPRGLEVPTTEVLAVAEGARGDFGPPAPRVELRRVGWLRAPWILAFGGAAVAAVALTAGGSLRADKAPVSAVPRVEIATQDPSAVPAPAAPTASSATEASTGDSAPPPPPTVAHASTPELSSARVGTSLTAAASPPPRLPPDGSPPSPPSGGPDRPAALGVARPVGSTVPRTRPFDPASIR